MIHMSDPGILLFGLYVTMEGGNTKKKEYSFSEIDTSISYQLGDPGIGKHRIFTQNCHVKDGCIISAKELYRDPIRFCFTLAAQFEMWKSNCEGKIDIATAVFLFLSRQKKNGSPKLSCPRCLINMCPAADFFCIYCRVATVKIYLISSPYGWYARLCLFQW